VSDRSGGIHAPFNILWLVIHATENTSMSISKPDFTK
jgi:hypothetical protein